MSETDYSQLWQEAIEPFRKDFNPSIFRAMFESGRIQQLSEEELVLLVDNHLIRDFIRKYAEPVIVERLSKQSKVTPKKITYVFRPKTKRAQKEDSSKESQMFHSATPSYELNTTLEVDPHLAANLNPKYTFENFIIGTKNRLAYAAAQAVAEHPGTQYNPLFLYGGVGLGKTHLMQAIGNAVIAKDPTKKVLYVACENFLNEFVSGLRKGNMEAFKKKYRNIDIFFVDDIQFIAGREGVQEEFFHTFNALHQGNKQVVMSSDKRPSDIKGLEERLSSRFSMGMIADMQFPDKDTRQAILQAKCQEKGVQLPATVLAFIAAQIETNIRELEGALNTVIAQLMTHNAEPTIEAVRASLETVISQQKAAKKSPASLLAELVCDQYSIDKADLLGPCRQKEMVRPRQVLMYLLKHEAGMTFPTIGREIGGRDHTTIMHGVEKITHELKKNPDFLSELQTIKNLFYEYK
jgi:chromosomal replication initiator protein